MAGLRLNLNSVGAAVACLLAFAMIVGPLCGTACVGSSCSQPAANSNEQLSCHNMQSHHGNHFLASPNNTLCQLGQNSLAVLSKPNLALKSVSAVADELILVTTNSHIADFLDLNAAAIFSSAGPPQRISSSGTTGLVLRI